MQDATTRTQGFAANLAALIAVARHEGISDQELLTLLREATDALVPVPSLVSRIVQSRAKKAPRPTPAIAVPTVVWRRPLRR